MIKTVTTQQHYRSGCSHKTWSL